MKLSVEKLYEWSKDRPLVSPEIHNPNDFYGHAAILKKYVGMSYNYQVKAVIEHGAFLPGFVWDVDINCPLPSMFVFSPLRYPIITRSCRKALFSLGPMIHYAPHYLDSEALENAKQRIGKNLLVFSPHTTHWTGYEYDIHGYCRILENFGKEFDTVRVCMFWKDVLDGVAEKYIEHGFECVTAGHMFDPLFLPRLKSIIELATVTTSTVLGTHVCYSVFMEKPIFLIEIDGKPVAANEQILQRDSPGSNDENSWSSTEIKKSFSEIRSDISQKQKDIANKHWGFSEVKTVPEMESMLQATEDIWKKGRTFFLSSRDVLTEQALDYLNSNDNEKALFSLEQAVAVNPHMQGLKYAKAVALARLGFKDEATETLDQLLSAIPVHEKAKLMLQALKKFENRPRIVNKPEEILKDCKSGKPVIALFPEVRGKDIMPFMETYLPFSALLEEKGTQVLYFFSPELYEEDSIDINALAAHHPNLYIMPPRFFGQMHWLDVLFIQDWYTRHDQEGVTFHENTKVVTFGPHALSFPVNSFHFYAWAKCIKNCDYLIVQQRHEEVDELYSEIYPKEMVNRPSKEFCFIPGGYFKFDNYLRYMDNSDIIPDTLLFAPTLRGEGVSRVGCDLVKDYGIEIIRALLRAFDCKIVFRPYPSERNLPVVQEIIKYFENENRFLADKSSNVKVAYSRAKVLISDHSHAAYSFSLSTLRPHINCCFGLKGKVHRNNMGYDAFTIDELLFSVRQALNDSENWHGHIEALRAKNLAFPGHTGEYIASNIHYILSGERHPEWHYISRSPDSGQKESRLSSYQSALNNVWRNPALRGFVGVEIAEHALREFPKNTQMLAMMAKMSLYNTNYMCENRQSDGVFNLRKAIQESPHDTWNVSWSREELTLLIHLLLKKDVNNWDEKKLFSLVQYIMTQSIDSKDV